MYRCGSIVVWKIYTTYRSLKIEYKPTRPTRPPEHAKQKKAVKHCDDGQKKKRKKDEEKEHEKLYINFKRDYEQNGEQRKHYLFNLH